MKRYLLITLLALLLLGLAASVQAAEEKKTTIVPYLELPGAGDPTKGIPQYIRYIFIFSLGVVGIVAFIAMLVAAFQYVTSVGNPQKAAAAKDRIFSALLGMLLLFGSYLLLNTINPDLLKFKTEIAGKKLDFPDTPDTGGGTGCRLTGAYWDKATINAEGNAILTFVASKECKEETVMANNFFEKTPKLTQHNPGILEFDPDCQLYYKSSEVEKKQNAWLINWLYTFNGHCTISVPVGILVAVPVSVCIDDPGTICNFIKDKMEIFYLEGEIKIKDGATQYMKKLSIDVRDLKGDGVCCR